MEPSPISADLDAGLAQVVGSGLITLADQGVPARYLVRIAVNVTVRPRALAFAQSQKPRRPTASAHR